MNLMQISKAVTDYKARGGEKTAATRVRDGLVQLVSVTYVKGKGDANVAPISEWMPIEAFAEWIAKK